LIKLKPIAVTVSPSNATNKKVNWTTSDANVATVDENGQVTAKAPGTATITVTPTADSSPKSNKTGYCWGIYWFQHMEVFRR